MCCLYPRNEIFSKLKNNYTEISSNLRQPVLLQLLHAVSFLILQTRPMHAQHQAKIQSCWLAPCSGVSWQMLLFAQIISYTACYTLRRVITVFTRVITHSYLQPVEYSWFPLTPISLRFILILSSRVKHNRPLWVAVQGPKRPTPYTYIHPPVYTWLKLCVQFSLPDACSIRTSSRPCVTFNNSLVVTVKVC
jgi:hypothetical protein